MEEKHEHKHVEGEHAHEHTHEAKEAKTETKEKVKAEKKPKKVKKELAVTRSNGLMISLKHSMAIGKFIKGKRIDTAMEELRSVIALKRAVPFKGEIPHRKGAMMSGRYPVNASKAFITVLKSLRGNVLENGMALEKTRITVCHPSFAARPMRKGGMHGKRINLVLEAREVSDKKEKHNG